MLMFGHCAHSDAQALIVATIVANNDKMEYVATRVAIAPQCGALHGWLSVKLKSASPLLARLTHDGGALRSNLR